MTSPREPGLPLPARLAAWSRVWAHLLSEPADPEAQPSNINSQVPAQPDAGADQDETAA